MWRWFAFYHQSWKDLKQSQSDLTQCLSVCLCNTGTFHITLLIFFFIFLFAFCLSSFKVKWETLVVVEAAVLWYMLSRVQGEWKGGTSWSRAVVADGENIFYGGKITSFQWNTVSFYVSGFFFSGQDLIQYFHFLLFWLNRFWFSPWLKVLADALGVSGFIGQACLFLLLNKYCGICHMVLRTDRDGLYKKVYTLFRAVASNAASSCTGENHLISDIYIYFSWIVCFTVFTFISLPNNPCSVCLDVQLEISELNYIL